MHITSQMYSMCGMKKGQACIISIPEFEDKEYLPSLVGYNKDVETLTNMWTSIGFDVNICTAMGGKRGLYAEVHVFTNCNILTVCIYVYICICVYMYDTNSSNLHIF